MPMWCRRLAWRRAGIVSGWLAGQQDAGTPYGSDAGRRQERAMARRATDDRSHVPYVGDRSTRAADGPACRRRIPPIRPCSRETPACALGSSCATLCHQNRGKKDVLGQRTYCGLHSPFPLSSVLSLLAYFHCERLTRGSTLG
jgi:hypothetical protein